MMPDVHDGILRTFVRQVLMTCLVSLCWHGDVDAQDRFTFRVRVRGRPGADGSLPLMRIKAGYFDIFDNHFRTLDSTRLSADEQVYEFAGHVRDFQFLDSIPAEHTYRDANVPRLTEFATNRVNRWCRPNTIGAD